MMDTYTHFHHASEHRWTLTLIFTILHLHAFLKSMHFGHTIVQSRLTTALGMVLAHSWAQL